jgi:ribonuclease D
MHSYGVHPEAVLCTRIAAKLADPKKEKYGSHSLKNILEKKLNVIIPKGEALSNWFADELTSEQIAYCINDVIYLHALVGSFRDEIDAAKMRDVFFNSGNFTSTYAFLQLMGYNARDLYEYE